MDFWKEMLSAQSKVSSQRFTLVFTYLVVLMPVMFVWTYLSLINITGEMIDIPGNVYAIVGTILGIPSITKLIQGKLENAAKKEECKDAGSPGK